MPYSGSSTQAEQQIPKRLPIQSPNTFLYRIYFSIATRAAIYRSLRALRARNRKNVSKRVFLGVWRKVFKNTRKSLKYRNSGAGNGCANFMDASKKCALSAGKTHVHKIPRFRGGGYFGFWGGGGPCRFYFYGREDFLIYRICFSIIVNPRLP